MYSFSTYYFTKNVPSCVKIAVKYLILHSKDNNQLHLAANILVLPNGR